jgi:hypothetical protein
MLGTNLLSPSCDIRIKKARDSLGLGKKMISNPIKDINTINEAKIIYSLFLK